MRLKKAEWFEAPHYWPDIEEWVDKALERGRRLFKPEHILREILLRKLNLFVVLDDREQVHGCVIGYVTHYPEFSSYSVSVIAGKNLKRWRHLIKDLEDYAKGFGCSTVEGTGRSGWTRYSARDGYEPVATIYRKILK